jgi:hypothetical protein
MGHLQVNGTLDLNQFWPGGTSDGDTAHVTVKRITFDDRVPTQSRASRRITVAKQYDLADLVVSTDVTFKPGDLVFQEAASTLYEERNRKIAAW